MGVSSLCHWTNGNFGLFDFNMDSEPDGILVGRLSEADSIPIPKAARTLGLDAYALYTLIQRERVQAGLSPSGEFVIANTELNRILKKG